MTTPATDLSRYRSFEIALLEKGIPLEEDDAGAVEWVAARLSAKQGEALLAFGDPIRDGTPSELGVSVTTLHSLWDFRRHERDCAAPLMLVTRDVDWDGTKFWCLTRFGKLVRKAVALGTTGGDA